MALFSVKSNVIFQKGTKPAHRADRPLFSRLVNESLQRSYTRFSPSVKTMEQA